jgi:N-acyl-D-aspartate/D-glutamate deacylase
MKTVATLLLFLMIVPAFLWSQTEQDNFDILIKDGTVYDGTGADPIQADAGIKGDRIVAIGKLDIEQALNVLDANGLAVAPGLINMLS